MGVKGDVIILDPYCFFVGLILPESFKKENQE